MTFYKKVSIAVTAVLIGGALYICAIENLGYTGIWYDETASFWISQGLHNYSDAREPRKGIRDVVGHNRYSNLDPGGHPVLLHFWTLVRQDLTWLRLLSFIFFLSSVAAMGLLARQWTGSLFMSLFAMFLPFAFDPILFFAFEIRAYSMEVAGIVIGSFFLARFFGAPRFTSLLALGISCGLFMGSRYTFFVFVAAAFCACILFALTRQKDERKRLLSLWPAFLAPVLVSAALIVYASLWHHLHHGMSREYMSAWILKGKSVTELLPFFRINFLSLPALPATAALAAYFVARPLTRRCFPRFHRTALRGGFAADTAPFYWLILFSQVSFFLLSLAGFTPWDISTKWGLHLVALSMIAALLLLTECYRVLAAPQGLRAARGVKGMGPLFPLCALALAGLLALHAARYRHVYAEDLAPAIEYLNSLPLPGQSVFVALYQVPAVRYLYEFGPFRESAGYPAMFRFEKEREWWQKTPIDAAAEGLRYVLSVQTPEDFNAKLVGAKAGKVAAVPHLLKLGPSS